MNRKGKLVLGIVAAALLLWGVLMIVVFSGKDKKKPEADATPTEQPTEMVSIKRIAKVHEQEYESEYDRLQFEYDEHGRIVRLSACDEDGVSGHAEYEYTADGRLAVITEYSRDGSVFSGYRYTYLTKSRYMESGPVAVCTKYNPSGVKEWEKEFEIGEHRRLVHYAEYNADGDETEKRSYYYDEAGKMIRMSAYRMSRVSSAAEAEWGPENYIDYQYNADGMLTGIRNGIRYEDGRGDIVTTRTELVTGQNGRYVEIHEINEKSGEKSTIPCEYDERGNRTAPIILSDMIPSAAVSVKRGTVEYDDRNRERAWVTGDLKSGEFRYEFNADGLISRYILQNEKGIVSCADYIYTELLIKREDAARADEILFLIDYRDVK